MNSRRTIPSLLLLLAVAVAGRADVKSDMVTFYAGIDNRLAGSEGNLALEMRVAALFAASGLVHGEMKFPGLAFEPRDGTISVTGLEPVTVTPLHPTLVRPGNFSDSRFEAPLLDLGRGTYDDLERLNGIPLDGAVALMDFDCGNNWYQLMRFGIRGFVFIAPESYVRQDALLKVYDSEVATPRYLASRADGLALRQALRATGTGAAATFAIDPSRWHRQELRNLWALVPGTDPDMKKDVVVLLAPLDANAVAPAAAFGAQSAANLFLLTRLLAHFRDQPPARTVLLVAVNGHCQGFLGERTLFWHLAAESRIVESMRNVLAEEARVQDLYVEKFSQLKLTPESIADDEKYLIALRSLEDRSTGRYLSVKEPLVALARRDVNLSKGAMIDLQRRSDLSDGERDRLKAELDEQYKQSVQVLTLFNKVGHRTVLSDLQSDEFARARELLQSYVGEVISRNRRWSELNRYDLRMSSENDRVRESLAGRRLTFAICLDLDWLSGQIGFGSDVEEKNRVAFKPRQFGVHTMRIAQALDEQMGYETPRFIDTMTNYGGLSEQHYFRDSYGAANHIQALAVPAFRLRNCFVDNGRAFLPVDTIENLSDTQLTDLFTYVPQLLSAIISDEQVARSSELPVVQPVYTVFGEHIKAYKFDEFSATVLPELPVPGSFVMLYPPAPFRTYGIEREPIVAGEVMSAFATLTDERAMATIYGCNTSSMASNAFRLDEDFVKVDHIIDAGDIHDKVPSGISAKTEFNGSMTIALFDCVEYPIYERADTSQIAYAQIGAVEFIIVDGRRNATPRKFGFSGLSSKSTRAIPNVNCVHGPVAAYLQPTGRVKLLTGLNRVQLPGIAATAELPEGIGYSWQDSPIPPDFIAATARDLSLLNRHRLQRLRGVTNELVDDFLTRGDAALAMVDAAAAANDHNAYQRAVAELLGNQKKAYDQIAGMTNDMLKAIIFYMALLLPFCFFIQKLLFKFVRIEAEMGVFAVIFVAAFVIFRNIHPAFRVAEAPEAIFIAFVMGALGAFVIMILHARFEGEMQLLFQTYTSMDTAEVGYSTVGQKAMLIGVNNMKRRRVRTALTTATIVLVAFTMLAFSSVSKRMSPTVVPVTKKTPYTGVFFQWPGSLRMDERTLRTVSDLFQDSADQLLVRRWLLPKKPSDTRVQPSPFPVRWQVDDRQGGANVDGILGLAKAEWDFLSPAGLPLIGDGAYFSADDAAEVILPAGTADAMGITPDLVGRAELEVFGHRLKLVGLVDDERFRALRDLNNLPILPIKGLQVAGFGSSDPQAEVEANRKLDPTAQDASTIFFVDTGALMLMPVDTLRNLGGEAFSVSIRFADDTWIWPAVDQLLTVTAARFFVGSRVPFSVGEEGRRQTSAGVYYIGSGQRTSIGGLTRLIIPLLIAATIILNTMLGSVFERKSEIAVYNAIGLNPTQIGLFFLAEAFVYSVIGSVGGYLIGQLLSIGLSQTDLVSGINLNFSSLSVVYVILFTIAVVMLSTLYPAVVATRAAVPSGKRKWSLPEHDGQNMQVAFPFIYRPQLAPGIIAYLQEYLRRYTEASLGDLIVSDERHHLDQDDAGRTRYSVSYHVALAPYDLGVTQTVTFCAAFDEKVESYRINMNVCRQSGQDANWVSTNVPFLEKLRKYLMHWRNLDVAEHQTYVTRGTESFGLQPASE